MAVESCSIPEFIWYLDPIADAVFSISLPIAECSIWVWCPCSPYEPWDYCSRSDSSCPIDNICDDDCAGPGGWYLRCGDACLGPPCFQGRFYGEVSIICRCPDEVDPRDSYRWSLTPDNPSLCSDFPLDQPHPWAVPYGRYTAGEHVPGTIFPAEDCAEGGRGVWTWCPCTDDDEGSIPGLQDCIRVIGGQDVEPRSVLGEYTEDGEYEGSPKYTNGNGWVIWSAASDEEWWISRTAGDGFDTSWKRLPVEDCPLGEYEPSGTPAAVGDIEVVPCCPDDGTNCRNNTSGDGEWIFRGGCEEFGPPPVLGRFYGETIMTGFCCEVSSSFLESSLSLSMSSLESPSSCSMPQFPVFWWDLVLQENPPWDQVLDRPDNRDECTVSGDCGAWLWCQCQEDMSSSCEVEWGEPACPFTPEDVDAANGEWLPYGGLDHHGPPCILGRFYGEVIWYCQCPQSSSYSESSKSSSSSPSSSLSPSSSSLYRYGIGGYKIVAPGESVEGYYNLAGYNDGMPWYSQCDGAFRMFFIDDDDDYGTWYISEQKDFSTPASAGYGGYVDTLQWPDEAVFNPIGSSTGSPDCYHDYDNCDPCASTLDITVSELTGVCAQANGTHTISKQFGSDYCYYYNEIYPGNCAGHDHIWILLEYICNVWWLGLNVEVCDPQVPETTYYNNWISDPKDSACPPTGVWAMHTVTDDCTGQIPTVTVTS